MERIAIFQFGYETNSLMGGFAQLEDLGAGGWTPGSQVIQMYTGKRAGLSGAIQAITELGVQAVPLDSLSRYGAFNAGPTICRQAAEEVIDHICSQLQEHYDEYDGVFYAMHGAGHADGIDDLDGYYLRRIREVIREKPITASLDLHANMTREMVQYADALIGIKTNPHVDFYDASYKAVYILADILRGKCNPHMQLRRMPFLVSSASANTLGGAAKELKDAFAQYVADKGLLDATFFHGFSGTDSKEAMASVLVVANGYDPVQEADYLAEMAWSKRTGFNCHGNSASEAVDEALSKIKNGYVVINEGSDNPGSGCPGDGTHLLREFIRRNLDHCIMGPLFDAEAAAVCHEHQVGEHFPLTVGGKHHPVYGDPLQLEDVELLALSDGDFVCASPVHRGATMHYGPSARLRCGHVEFIVVSNRFQTYDDRPYQMLGAYLENYRIVGLKSINHFRAFFKDTADALVAADTPSIYPGDLRKIDYKFIRRPVYPLDEAQYSAEKDREY